MARPAVENEVFRLLRQVAMRPPLDSEWPETCAPRELIDRLVRFGMGPGVFHFWKDDRYVPVLENEADACSLRFPLALRTREVRERIARAHATLLRDFPRIRPRWVWLASCGGNAVKMGGYVLSPQGMYRRLSPEEAERLLQRTTRPAGERVASMRDLLSKMDALPGIVGVAYDSSGRDITEAVFPNEARRKAEPGSFASSLRAMERWRPGYIAMEYPTTRSEFPQPYYILQKDGSYLLGRNAVTDLIDRFGSDPVSGAIRWKTRRAFENDARAPIPLPTKRGLDSSDAIFEPPVLHP